ARVLARGWSPARSPDLLRSQDTLVGVGGSPGVRTVARRCGVAREAPPARRLFAPALLPIGARGLGALLRADRAAAIRGPRAQPPAREAAGRRRRAHLARGSVHGGGARGRARVRAARAQAVEPAARRLWLRALLCFQLPRRRGFITEIGMVLEPVLHD